MVAAAIAKRWRQQEDDEDETLHKELARQF